jgi:DNA-directed RNA polymerase subunit RPC12/RpoP
MSNIFSSKCNKCDFETSVSSGSYLYVLDENGKKIICGHPVEDHTIAEVLKVSRDDAFAWILQQYDKISAETKKKIDDSVGMNYQYICLDCFAESYLDKKRDEMRCGKCGSANIVYVAELVNKPCPKCKEGIIQMINKGMS